MGLMAGYYGGWVEAVLMRLTDVFISVPPLVLALAILGFLQPTLGNAMMAVSAMWWPWYARLTYNLARSVRVEGYVVAAEVVGASQSHILYREILPNCVPPLLIRASSRRDRKSAASCSEAFLHAARDSETEHE
jgi:peptide/nickel transport system permease protein